MSVRRRGTNPHGNIVATVCVVLCMYMHSISVRLTTTAFEYNVVCLCRKSIERDQNTRCVPDRLNMW